MGDALSAVCWALATLVWVRESIRLAWPISVMPGVCSLLLTAIADVALALEDHRVLKLEPFGMATGAYSRVWVALNMVVPGTKWGARPLCW
jgi:hypothetical protein